MTWEPGVPVYPNPGQRAREGGDPEWQQSMIAVRDDIHDQDVDLFGYCAMCDDPAVGRDPGAVWSKLIKAGAR